MGGSTRNAADVFKVLTVSGLRGTRDPAKNWESWQWVSKFVEWQRVWALLKIGNKHILQDIQPPRKSGIQINWMYDISIFWCTSTNGSKTGDFSQWMYHPTSPPWLYFVIAGRRRCLALTSLFAENRSHPRWFCDAMKHLWAASSWSICAAAGSSHSANEQSISKQTGWEWEVRRGSRTIGLSTEECYFLGRAKSLENRQWWKGRLFNPS